MLDVLGLDEAEERAYRWLIELPSGTADDLAGPLGYDVSRAASILSALEAKGLVARSTSGPDRFVASPPAIALGALFVERQEELRHAQLELDALAAVYRGTASDRTLNEVIDVVRGPQAVAQRFAQLQRTAKSEVQVLVKADFAVVAPEDNADEDVAVARGVQYRVAVERAMLDRPGAYEGAADSLRHGVLVRVTQSVPIRLVIADRAIALVPLLATADDDLAGGALLIHPSGLLDALQSMFDFVWESASQLVLAGDTVGEDTADRPNELDAQVLSLLLAGFTDQAIGGQLDLSLRTVQRRVRLLMDRARVDTRLQLGYQACRRGWL
ncbi:helix-turn-helix domain-containing protein [Angustibacter sp. McL0619]|uniref:helix-turn-helix domain-containing protein n=1 Tax=Angustibacter sp. McL0619 TaxID=3415676 RepID=UPI003CEE5451